MKTQFDILLETVEYYRKDPNSRRGRDGSTTGCMYYTNNHQMCALGRCMIDPKAVQDSSLGSHGLDDWAGRIPYGDNENVYNVQTYLDAALKEEYRGHPVEFWMEIQYLHDEPSYWDSLGLTESGEARVHEMMTDILNNRWS